MDLRRAVRVHLADVVYYAADRYPSVSIRAHEKQLSELLPLAVALYGEVRFRVHEALDLRLLHREPLNGFLRLGHQSPIRFCGPSGCSTFVSYLAAQLRRTGEHSLIFSSIEEGPRLAREWSDAVGDAANWSDRRLFEAIRGEFAPYQELLERAEELDGYGLRIEAEPTDLPSYEDRLRSCQGIISGLHLVVPTRSAIRQRFDAPIGSEQLRQSLAPYDFVANLHYAARVGAVPLIARPAASVSVPFAAEDFDLVAVETTEAGFVLTIDYGKLTRHDSFRARLRSMPAQQVMDAASEPQVLRWREQAWDALEQREWRTARRRFNRVLRAFDDHLQRAEPGATDPFLPVKEIQVWPPKMILDLEAIGRLMKRFRGRIDGIIDVREVPET